VILQECKVSQSGIMVIPLKKRQSIKWTSSYRISSSGKKKRFMERKVKRKILPIFKDSKKTSASRGGVAQKGFCVRLKI